MSNEKRFLLCILLIFGWVMVAPNLFRSLGLMPPPPAKKAAPADLAKAAVKSGAGESDTTAKDKEKEKKDAQAQAPSAAEKASEKAVAQAGGKPAATAEIKPKAAAIVPASELVLGSATDKSPGGYRLELQLEQKGAGVESALSSRFDAEFEGRRNPHLPLRLIARDPFAPASLSLTFGGDPTILNKMDKLESGNEAEAPEFIPDPEDLLDSVLWDVVRDSEGRTVRPLSGTDSATGATVEGQEVVFQTIGSNEVKVTKTIRLWQMTNGFEVELKFESPEKDRTFTYNLYGPHGIPIEGEWYTGTFREVFFGTYNHGTVKVDTHTAYDVAKGKTIDSTALPLRFTGVENQYFANLMAPVPAPTGDDDRIDRETRAVTFHKDEKSLQKSNVGVRITSRPVHVSPNLSVVHTFRVFTGPKTEEALAPYNASMLASYRKSSFIPGASYVARFVITPTLSLMYDLTRWVARLFGGTSGNWGIAIILLTLTVKLLMFPLGRKQALMAQRTQALQPELKKIQEKYKDAKDKTEQTRETFALYKKHGVNPVSGCIPALIQLPIFVGLWQALNTSVSLRHSPFLWINDLAAPDMLARLPVDVMFLGHWFNLLPILVVGLMLFQTKLFAPPATTPEAEMQQKMMKYMMIFMAVMFYKVPSGLGIYFITSSLWSIGERLLLPKISHAKEEKSEGDLDAGKGGSGPRGKGGSGGGNGPVSPRKPLGAFSQFMEKILEEARKDSTYRKYVEETDAKDKGRKPDGDDRRDRDRGKPRARPGRK
ncbi:MAG: YidC/Oxa1 family insertase periplasmic-domain containing protein [Planctomycetaceae bacterium]|nr:YidC/Oxa1 family insertase periplasmic-domain containing protein [Planctomycetaceae bacterium]